MGKAAPALAASEHALSIARPPEALSARHPAATPAHAGNQAHLRRLAAGGQPLQPKLMVGTVDDPLEHEADAAADRVMRMVDPAVSMSAAPMLSRKCAKCATCEDEEQMLHREATGAAMAGDTAPPIVDAVLSAPGRALDPATHDFMASRFGADFSDVRVHTDAQAAQSAAAVEARAYTVGRNVVFASGQYDPLGTSGRHLLAHELAHVVQQNDGDRTLRRRPPDTQKKSGTVVPARRFTKIVVDEGSPHGTAFYDDGSDFAIELSENKLAPGEYKLTRSGGKSATGVIGYAGKSNTGKPFEYFVWKGRAAENVTVLVIPKYVREFLTATADSHASATLSPAEEAMTARILTLYGVSENELLIEHQRQVDQRATGTSGARVSIENWALSFVGQRQSQEETALADHTKLDTAANRLANVDNDLRQVVLARIDGASWEDKILTVVQIQNPRFSWGNFTGYADLNATIDEFSASVENALHALTEGMLNEAAATIFKVQRTFIGTWDRGVGYGYLGRQLDEARQDPDIIKTQGDLAQARTRAAVFDNEIIQIAAARAPIPEKTQKNYEAATKVVDGFEERLREILSEKWQIRVAGVRGIDADALLHSGPDHAQHLLAGGLADAQRKINDARQRLRDEKTFVFKADRIVALLKKQLGIAPKSPLDQFVDAIVSKGASPGGFWSDLWEVINFVVGFVPPPAGPIMRAVVSGISLGQAFTEHADQALAHDTNLASTGPSSLAGLLLVTAAGTLFDAGELSKLGALERETLTLGFGAAREAGVIGQAEITFARETARSTGVAAEVVEGEIAELQQAVRKPGRLRVIEGEAQDAEMTTRNALHEDHVYDRQAGTDIWCRHSEEGPCNPLPVLNAEVEEAKAAAAADAPTNEAAASATADASSPKRGRQWNDDSATARPVGPESEVDADALAQSGMRRSAAYAGQHQHHIFPQEAELQTWFEERFAASNVSEDIHEYTVYLSEGDHQVVHLDQTKYKGKPVTLSRREIAMGKKPYAGWNNDWKAFKAANEEATAQQIFEEAGRLMDKYDISEAKIDRYMGTKK